MASDKPPTPVAKLETDIKSATQDGAISTEERTILMNDWKAINPNGSADVYKAVNARLEQDGLLAPLLLAESGQDGVFNSQDFSKIGNTDDKIQPDDLTFVENHGDPYQQSLAYAVEERFRPMEIQKGAKDNDNRAYSLESHDGTLSADDTAVWADPEKARQRLQFEQQWHNLVTPVAGEPQYFVDFRNQLLNGGVTLSQANETLQKAQQNGDLSAQQLNGLIYFVSTLTPGVQGVAQGLMSDGATAVQSVDGTGMPLPDPTISVNGVEYYAESLGTSIGVVPDENNDPAQKNEPIVDLANKHADESQSVAALVPETEPGQGGDQSGGNAGGSGTQTDTGGGTQTDTGGGTQTETGAGTSAGSGGGTQIGDGQGNPSTGAGGAAQTDGQGDSTIGGADNTTSGDANTGGVDPGRQTKKMPDGSEITTVNGQVVETRTPDNTDTQFTYTGNPPSLSGIRSVDPDGTVHLFGMQDGRWQETTSKPGSTCTRDLVNVSVSQNGTWDVRPDAQTVEEHYLSGTLGYFRTDDQGVQTIDWHLPNGEREVFGGSSKDSWTHQQYHKGESKPYVDEEIKNLRYTPGNDGYQYDSSDGSTSVTQLFTGNKEVLVKESSGDTTMRGYDASGKEIALSRMNHENGRTESVDLTNDPPKITITDKDGTVHQGTNCAYDAKNDSYSYVLDGHRYEQRLKNDVRIVSAVDADGNPTQIERVEFDNNGTHQVWQRQEDGSYVEKSSGKQAKVTMDDKGWVRVKYEDQQGNRVQDTIKSNGDVHETIKEVPQTVTWNVQEGECLTAKIQEMYGPGLSSQQVIALENYIFKLNQATVFVNQDTGWSGHLQDSVLDTYPDDPGSLIKPDWSIEMPTPDQATQIMNGQDPSATKSGGKSEDGNQQPSADLQAA